MAVPRPPQGRAPAPRQRAQALLAGYQTMRVLGEVEWRALPTELRWAALRFTTTRLTDVERYGRSESAPAAAHAAQPADVTSTWRAVVARQPPRQPSPRPAPPGADSGPPTPGPTHSKELPRLRPPAGAAAHGQRGRSNQNRYANHAPPCTTPLTLRANSPLYR